MVFVPRTRKEAMEALRREPDNRPLSPCTAQTPEQIEAYYRTEPIGSPAVVRHTADRQLRYVKLTITDRNNRHVFINGRAFTMKSGVVYDRRIERTHLVVPTQPVLDWAAEHPWGASGWSCPIR